MRRREFIAGLGGAAVWPVVARGQQQPTKLPAIGLLGSDTAVAQIQMTDAFLERLRELGWSAERNLVIEYRWAEGHTERLVELANELVRLKVDLIVTHNTPPTLAAKKATSAIPIVFASAGDPVGSGIVASLSRPGGNVAGMSSVETETAGKRVELLHELLPDLRGLAVLTDVGNPNGVRVTSEATAAAHRLGLKALVFEIRQDEDIDAAFKAFQGRAQALYVEAVPVLFANRDRINTLALAARLPTMHGVQELAKGGGLMSYGPDWPDMWRRSADLVDKILRGTKPSDIPVEQPIKFDLVINLKTSKAIGLKVPPTLLARADEVIE